MNIEELTRKCNELEQRLERVEAYVDAQHRGWAQIRSDAAKLAEQEAALYKKANLPR